MRLSKDEIKAVARLRESVLQFERPHPRMLVWQWLTLPLFIGDIVTLFHPTSAPYGFFLLGILLVVLIAWPITAALARNQHRRDKILLEILERDHGDQLTWMQIEPSESDAKTNPVGPSRTAPV
jgi:hypothetical protein